MLTECSCFNRMCKFYEGMEESNNLGRPAKHICKAFPKGIPDEIVAGKNEHLTSMPGQNNNKVYERATSYAEVEMFKSKRGF